MAICSCAATPSLPLRRASELGLPCSNLSVVENGDRVSGITVSPSARTQNASAVSMRLLSRRLQFGRSLQQCSSGYVHRKKIFQIRSAAASNHASGDDQIKPAASRPASFFRRLLAWPFRPCFLFRIRWVGLGPPPAADSRRRLLFLRSISGRASHFPLGRLYTDWFVCVFARLLWCVSSVGVSFATVRSLPASMFHASNQSPGDKKVKVRDVIAMRSTVSGVILSPGQISINNDWQNVSKTCPTR